MTKPICTCEHTFCWPWEDAFDKFGFGDGDGDVMTHVVQAALEDAGYVVEALPWGMHNTVIVAISDASGTGLIPATARVGYDNPREYLPLTLVQFLDGTFGSGGAR